MFDYCQIPGCYEKVEVRHNLICHMHRELISTVNYLIEMDLIKIPKPKRSPRP